MNRICSIEGCTQKKHYANKRKEVQYVLAHNLRSRLYDALNGRIKVGSAVSDCGLTISELKIHIESLWQPGMSWDNYGSEWSIDHIKPLISFDLTDHSQFMIAVNYTNLRPLWNSEQFSKATKDKEQRWKN
jgi:hypothetical protein